MRHSKQFLLPLLVAGGFVFAACNGKGGQSDAVETTTEEAAAGEGSANDATSGATNVKKEVAWSIDGNTLTYGSHTYTMQGDFNDDYVANGKASVTFTNIPTDFREFQTVYEQLLGTTTYGTAALVPIAFEMWGRDHAVGEECLKLITGGTCYTDIMREMPRHMEASQYSPSDDPYVQRCLPAAMMQGATKENGYNPDYPYTINMVIGLAANWGRESEILQGHVYQLNIMTGNAWNTPQRSVTVMRSWRGEGNLFKVNACSSTYVNIYVPRQDWKGLK